jgi:hypothetical protein
VKSNGGTFNENEITTPPVGGVVVGPSQIPLQDFGLALSKSLKDVSRAFDQFASIVNDQLKDGE